MKMNPVGWFEIYVQDMSRAKKFYEKVFNKNLTKLENPELDMWAFPMEKDAPGATGSLVKMQGVPSGGCSTIVYFMTEDCAVEEKRAVEAGGKVMKPKMSIGPYGFISLVYDSEGNIFGIHSMK